VATELKAPERKFRVIGIDKFHPPNEDDWFCGDYDSLGEALSEARKMSWDASKYSSDPRVAEVYYVYYDEGVYRGGDIYNKVQEFKTKHEIGSS